jgi:prepilin-type N-terminal cleavage/methylation domain-containing protein
MSGKKLRTGRAGFTLIEIVLVVVIIGIAAAVAVPAFAKSFRGAKLRASTRLALGMHRNAQTKAVLGQRYVAILFDEVKGTLELVDQGQTGQKKDAFFEDVGGGSEAPVPQSMLVRKLEEGVKIVSFEGGKEVDGIYYVRYYPNGMCDAFELELGDDENRSARIKVDAVTGKAKVEK